MTKTRALQAFSLIEVMVALAITAIILTATVALFANAVRDGTRARVLAEMSREGAYVGALMSMELRQAGVGVPSGDHIDGGYAGGGPTDFYANVIIAGAAQVGIVADLPQPDANFNTFGHLDSRLAAGGNEEHHVVTWHNENNGSCSPTPGESCAGLCCTANTSLFFPGESGCNPSSDVTALAGGRTCPWGMKRARVGDRLQFVGAGGAWSHSEMGNLHTHDSLVQVRLNADFAAPWDNRAAGTSLEHGGGLGYVTTIDRLFYRQSGTSLLRDQCWGDPDPDNANWPPAGTGTIPGSLAVTPTGGVANICVQELIARNIDALTFEYFDDTDTLITGLPLTGAAKATVARIGFRIRMKRVVDGRDVIHEVAGSAQLRNPAP